LTGKTIAADFGVYGINGQIATIVFGGNPPIVATDELLIKLRSFTERRRF
jgi:hypothetical protein